MPKIRTLRTKKAPAGWELIEPTLSEMMNAMRDAENEPHEGKRKVESGWKILKLHHQRSRYIYDLYYKKKVAVYLLKEISKELYEYCLNEKWADASLIAKWKKNGYEKLCCIACINNEHNFQGVCACRVPKSKLAPGKLIQCVHCGCRGCASCD
jgi:bud site selection protein 31